MYYGHGFGPAQPSARIWDNHRHCELIGGFVGAQKMCVSVEIIAAVSGMKTTHDKPPAKYCLSICMFERSTLILVE